MQMPQSRVPPQPSSNVPQVLPRSAQVAGTQKQAHSHEGQEFDYVLEGTLKIVLGGNELYLQPGDSIYYDSSLPHVMYAVEGDCRFIAVVINNLQVVQAESQTRDDAQRPDHATLEAIAALRAQLDAVERQLRQARRGDAAPRGAP